MPLIEAISDVLQTAGTAVVLHATIPRHLHFGRRVAEYFHLGLFQALKRLPAIVEELGFKRVLRDVISCIYDCMTIDIGLDCFLLLLFLFSTLLGHLILDIAQTQRVFVITEKDSQAWS